jgi:hypothetical protein
MVPRCHRRSRRHRLPVRGGTGANFVVDWAAAGEIAEPAVEALMVGGVGAGHYAFVSQGRPVRPIGKNQSLVN